MSFLDSHCCLLCDGQLAIDMPTHRRPVRHQDTNVQCTPSGQIQTQTIASHADLPVQKQVTDRPASRCNAEDLPKLHLIDVISVRLGKSWSSNVPTFTAISNSAARSCRVSGKSFQGSRLPDAGDTQSWEQPENATKCLQNAVCRSRSNAMCMTVLVHTPEHRYIFAVRCGRMQLMHFPSLVNNHRKVCWPQG